MSESYNMTWGEFKAFVDEYLEREGIRGDPEIWYIDIAYPRNPRPENKYGMDVPEPSVTDQGLAVHS